MQCWHLIPLLQVAGLLWEGQCVCKADSALSVATPLEKDSGSTCSVEEKQIVQAHL